MQAQGLFQPRTDQLIYVEEEYHEAVNQLLLREYKSILADMEKTMKRVSFVFMPQLFKDMKERAILSVSAGWDDHRAIFARFDYFTSAFLTHLLLSKSDFRGTFSPGLIRFTGEKGDDGQYVFEYFPFDLSDLPKLVAQYLLYVKRIRLDSAPRKESSSGRNTSIYEWMMTEAGGYKKSASIYDQLSPLVIQETKKKGGDMSFQILLPAYDNLEIIISPLPQALYILFLCHPEGIKLRYLANYQKELTDIYNLIPHKSYEDDPVKRLCTHGDNSIHEKINQIKKAFALLPENEYTQQYIVDSLIKSDRRVRGKAVGILLERDQVTLPDSIMRIPRTVTNKYRN
jgi:hypothetical protein